MKLILILCALMALVIPTSGCAEKIESHETSDAKPGVFTAKIDDPRYAAEVAVVTPENKFLYLKQSDLDCSGADVSKSKLMIDLAAAVGVEWIDGKPNVGYVFNEVGNYKILISDNLETELENSYSRVFKVFFSPDAKNSSYRNERKDAGCQINGESLKIQQ